MSTSPSRPSALRLGLVLAGLAVVAAACGTPPAAAPSPVPSPPARAADATVECHVAAVGDSLTVGVQPHLASALAGQDCSLAWIDARGGRLTEEGVDVLTQRARAGQLPDILVVGLGTNDRYRQADFPRHVDTVMRLAGSRQVIWIDIAHTPIRANLNRILDRKSRQHPNLTVMAWDGPYWANAAWRATDGVHATPAGYRARAELMADLARSVTK